jgi:hypothetical protein
MGPKHYYTIRWTQPYSFGVGLAELDALMDELIELDIEAGNMMESKTEIERIMKL